MLAVGRRSADAPVWGMGCLRAIGWVSVLAVDRRSADATVWGMGCSRAVGGLASHRLGMVGVAPQCGGWAMAPLLPVCGG